MSQLYVPVACYTVFKPCKKLDTACEKLDIAFLRFIILYTLPKFVLSRLVSAFLNIGMFREKYRRHGMRRCLLFVTQCLYRAQKLHTASRILEIGFLVFLLRCTLQQFVLSNFVSNCSKRDVSTKLVRSDGSLSAMEATARVSGDVLVQVGMCIHGLGQA